jgi:hypothetical protein
MKQEDLHAEDPFYERGDSQNFRVRAGFIIPA